MRLVVHEYTTFEDMRAAASSPHELMSMLDTPEARARYGYWLEFWKTDDEGNEGPEVVNIYAHGPEWVCLKPDEADGEPVWTRWENLPQFRLIAQ